MRYLRSCLIGAALLVSLSAAQADICVSCAGPAATYDCTVKKADQIEGLAGAKTVNKICIKVLKRTGSHASCEVVEATSCPGSPKTIGWREVKEALASADDPDPPAKAPPANAVAKPTPPVKSAASPSAATPRQPESLPKAASGPPAGEPADAPEESTIAGNIKGAAEKTWNCLASLFGKC